MESDVIFSLEYEYYYYTQNYHVLVRMEKNHGMSALTP